MTDNNGATFYRHSGALGTAVPMFLLLGIPIGILLSAIYAYLVVYIPLVGYVTVLLLGGFVFGVGFSLSLLAKFSKCRNATVLFLLGSIVGVVAVYFSWVFFFKAGVGEKYSILTEAMNPQRLWEDVCFTNKNGWWDGGPSGIFAWITTGIEALVVIIGSGFLTMVGIDREVFCEQCNSWCEQTAEKHLQITEEFANKKEQAVGSAWDHFEILKLPDAASNEYPRFAGDVLQCTGCGDTTAIRLKMLSLKEGENGPEEEQQDIDGILLILNEA